VMSYINDRVHKVLAPASDCAHDWPSRDGLACTGCDMPDYEHSIEACLHAIKERWPTAVVTCYASPREWEIWAFRLASGTGCSLAEALEDALLGERVK
jgi:hypothetical protein